MCQIKSKQTHADNFTLTLLFETCSLCMRSFLKHNSFNRPLYLDPLLYFSKPCSVAVWMVRLTWVLWDELGQTHTRALSCKARVLD